ncbi:chromosomal replication initiator protein DnaA [Spiroplasma gladiatoris]|uniref:Chromosomal replication initiator protein DnaA n=1 Tax=Spiroplasma gladiatoris TaxID=2143 RepID=A0A4P7AGG0_9MOLU|nr:chromosomal replication initiator protein DnaA [Spiroplasma gladiatoris]QBQ07202.1 chromosomal replication initiator protein DnaA [Spiroplasma gladiatoris]
MKNSELWKNIKGWLITSENVEPNIYDDYIKKATLETLSQDHLAIVVSSEVAKKHLEYMKNNINKQMNYLLEKEIVLSILTNEAFNKEKSIQKIVDKQKKNKNNEFSFENFIPGISNKNALEATKAVVNNLGNKWNPLFIFGDSGLGKTHLLKAINNELCKKQEGIEIKYYTSSDFRKEIIDSLQGGFHEIEATKNKFNNLDVLLIDDIQFLAKSDKTNEIFFDLFNSCIENNKQIVITSDKYAEALNGFDKRLISRFTQGLNVKIEKPDTITAINIIDHKAKVANINLSDEAKRYIASYYGSDVRKIEGAINKIEFALIQNKIDSSNLINDDEVTVFLSDYSYAPGGEITVQKIKNVVSQNYGIAPNSIDSKIRLQKVVLARHLAMYLTGELLKRNYTEIGVSFGGKDHTTVMHAFKKINELINTDKVFKKLLIKIKKEITS